MTPIFLTCNPYFMNTSPKSAMSCMFHLVYVKVRTQNVRFEVLKGFFFPFAEITCNELRVS